MSLYDGISVETAPIPEITDNVKKKDEGTNISLEFLQYQNSGYMDLILSVIMIFFFWERILN